MKTLTLNLISIVIIYLSMPFCVSMASESEQIAIKNNFLPLVVLNNSQSTNDKLQRAVYQNGDRILNFDIAIKGIKTVKRLNAFGLISLHEKIFSEFSKEIFLYSIVTPATIDNAGNYQLILPHQLISSNQYISYAIEIRYQQVVLLKMELSHAEVKSGAADLYNSRLTQYQSLRNLNLQYEILIKR